MHALGRLLQAHIMANLAANWTGYALRAAVANYAARWATT